MDRLRFLKLFCSLQLVLVYTNLLISSHSYDSIFVVLVYLQRSAYDQMLDMNLELDSPMNETCLAGLKHLVQHDNKSDH